MDKNRYYFSNFIEDDFLSRMAVKAREAVEQHDNIVQIFRLNNAQLYGHSPRQTLFLMKQNNKSIFTPRSSNESSPSDAKSNVSPSTPVRSIPNIINMPRRYLPFYDAEKKASHTVTSEFSPPTGCQNPISQPDFEAIINSILAKAGASHKQFASPFGFSDRSAARNQESSLYAQIAQMTANLKMPEKEFGCPIKVSGRMDASSQESPPYTEQSMMPSDLDVAEKLLSSPAREVNNTLGSPDSPRTSQITRMAAGLTMDDGETRNIGGNKLGSPREVSNTLESPDSPRTSQITRMAASLTMDDEESRNIGGNKLESQESPRTPKLARITANLWSPAREIENELESQKSPRTSELARMTVNLTEDDDESRNVGGDQLAGHFVARKDSPNPEEISGVSENQDSTNKIIIRQAKGTQISNPAIIESETSSPVKRTKMCSIPTYDAQEFSSSAKHSATGNSSKDTEITSSDIPVDIFSSPPNETIDRIVRDDRKRKSLSPRKKSTTPFKSMPRVVKLDGEEEIGIEVIDLEYGASPKPYRSKSADYQSESPKDGSITKSPLVGESNANPSRKTPERFLRPSERAISSGASGTHSPGSDDDVFAGKCPSSPSAVATPARNRSSKFEYSSEDIAANPLLLKATVKKFKTLLDLRDSVVRKSFISFQTFQTSVNYLTNYVSLALYIILTIGASGKYSSEALEEIVRDTNAIAPKLMNKLKSWKKDLDFDIDTWRKCFRQIENLKAVNEPLLTGKGEPAIPFEVLQVYENKMKAIWKKIDEMAIQGDSRRALFSHFSRDVERLMKMFVKCLILVGVLQPR